MATSKFIRNKSIYMLCSALLCSALVVSSCNEVAHKPTDTLVTMGKKVVISGEYRLQSYDFNIMNYATASMQVDSSFPMSHIGQLHNEGLDYILPQTGYGIENEDSVYRTYTADFFINRFTDFNESDRFSIINFLEDIDTTQVEYILDTINTSMTSQAVSYLHNTLSALEAAQQRPFSQLSLLNSEILNIQTQIVTDTSMTEFEKEFVASCVSIAQYSAWYWERETLLSAEHNWLTSIADTSNYFHVNDTLLFQYSASGLDTLVIEKEGSQVVVTGNLFGVWDFIKDTAGKLSRLAKRDYEGGVKNVEKLLNNPNGANFTPVGGSFATLCKSIEASASGTKTAPFRKQ